MRSQSLGARIALWILVVIVAAGGVYVGLFTSTFALDYQDIDGRTPFAGRVVVFGIGALILVPSLLLARWCYRHRPWAALSPR